MAVPARNLDGLRRQLGDVLGRLCTLEGGAGSGPATFQSLTDADNLAAAHADKVVKVNATGDGLTFGVVLGGAASKNVGTSASTVAAGDDGRITGAAQKASNLADLANAATARSNLSLVIGTHVQAWDADLDAIAALTGTSGLLKKAAANAWALDTSAYLTGITSSQVTTALGFTPLSAAAAAFSGSAAKWTTARTLTLGGDLTGNQTFDGSANFTLTGTVANNAITYAKLQDVSATQRVLGRNTAGAGDPEEVTLSQLLDWVGSAAQGDLLFRGSTSWARLGAGAAGDVLMSGGAAANPSWAKAARVLAKRTTVSGAIANSETVVTSATVPANTLQVGSVLRLQATGVMTNTTTASTSTWRIRIGPVSLSGAQAAASAFVNATTARTNAIFTVDALVLITAIGASGQAIGQIVPALGSTGAAPPSGVTATVTVDTTVANLVEFTFVSGATTTTATFHAAVLELIP